MSKVTWRLPNGSLPTESDCPRRAGSKSKGFKYKSLNAVQTEKPPTSKKSESGVSVSPRQRRHRRRQRTKKPADTTKVRVPPPQDNDRRETPLKVTAKNVHFQV